jgi:hypothetical protein
VAPLAMRRPDSLFLQVNRLKNIIENQDKKNGKNDQEAVTGGKKQSQSR